MFDHFNFSFKARISKPNTHIAEDMIHTIFLPKRSIESTLIKVEINCDVIAIADWKFGFRSSPSSVIIMDILVRIPLTPHN